MVPDRHAEAEHTVEELNSPEYSAADPCRFPHVQAIVSGGLRIPTYAQAEFGQSAVGFLPDRCRACCATKRCRTWWRAPEPCPACRSYTTPRDTTSPEAGSTRRTMWSRIPKAPYRRLRTEGPIFIAAASISGTRRPRSSEGNASSTPRSASSPGPAIPSTRKRPRRPISQAIRGSVLTRRFGGPHPDGDRSLSRVDAARLPGAAARARAPAPAAGVREAPLPDPVRVETLDRGPAAVQVAQDGRAGRGAGPRQLGNTGCLRHRFQFSRSATFRSPRPVRIEVAIPVTTSALPPAST